MSLDAAAIDGVPQPRKRSRWRLATGPLIAIAIVAGIVAFLVLVVGPSAGAAGGCGGG
jgi:hypothetical protein